MSIILIDMTMLGNVGIGIVEKNMVGLNSQIKKLYQIKLELIEVGNIIEKLNGNLNNLQDRPMVCFYYDIYPIYIV